MSEPREPWWASGRSADEGLGPEDDVLGAFRAARNGSADGDAGSRRERGGGSEERGSPGSPPHWLTDLVEMLTQVAAAGAARMGAAPSANGDDAPHPPDQVCDACPVCIGLRAVRQVKPDTIAHLAEAARHVSLALKSFADAQAQGADDGFEPIDLDEE